MPVIFPNDMTVDDAHRTALECAKKNKELVIVLQHADDRGDISYIIREHDSLEQVVVYDYRRGHKKSIRKIKIKK